MCSQRRARSSGRYVLPGTFPDPTRGRATNPGSASVPTAQRTPGAARPQLPESCLLEADDDLARRHFGWADVQIREVRLHPVSRLPGGFLGACLIVVHADRDSAALVGLHQVVGLEARNPLEQAPDLVLAVYELVGKALRA